MARLRSGGQERPGSVPRSSRAREGPIHLVDPMETLRARRPAFADSSVVIAATATGAAPLPDTPAADPGPPRGAPPQSWSWSWSWSSSSSPARATARPRLSRLWAVWFGIVLFGFGWQFVGRTIVNRCGPLLFRPIGRLVLHRQGW